MSKTLECAFNGKDYKLVFNQSQIKIMDHATVEGNYEHKLISAYNRGRLNNIKVRIFFLIIKEKLDMPHNKTLI